MLSLILLSLLLFIFNLIYNYVALMLLNLFD